jgi:hypothetical protein
MCKKDVKKREAKAARKQRMKWYTPRLLLRVFPVLRKCHCIHIYDYIDVGIPEPDFRRLIGLS